MTHTRVLACEHQLRHVFVLTQNTPPLGTFGVRVVLTIVIQPGSAASPPSGASLSKCSCSCWISHFVDLGPMGPLSGLMYESVCVWRDGLEEEGVHSDLTSSIF